VPARAAVPVILVGYNAQLLGALDAIGRHRVIVVEEPDLIASKDVAARLPAHGCVERLVETSYQQSDAILDLADGPLRRPAAVVSGQEYAVRATAALAAHWRLPGAGTTAAALLTNKILLRRKTARAGMVTPAWREVRCLEELAAFARAHGSVVLKPANRQASVGVHLLGPHDDLQAAWSGCTSAQESIQVAKRPMRWRYLVEERLHGDEFSVEALVRRGEIAFLNITRKHLLPGAHPVELGHDVPAPLAPYGANALEDATRRLVGAVGFGTGMVHAEFKLRRGPGGRPLAALIECAGRPPGDRIVALINHAYGVDLHGALVDLLCDRPLDLPSTAARAAAVRFLAGPTGTIEGAEGIDTALGMPGVLDAAFFATPGTLVNAVTSSWDRLAYVIAGGTEPLEAALRAQRALAAVHVHTAELPQQRRDAA
jgi:biotin carboxylase